MEKRIFLVIILLCLISLGLKTWGLKTIVKADTLVWTDEFASQNSRWEWSYYAGTGYHTLKTVDNLSVVEIGITTQSSNQSYSDCSLHENGYTHNNGIAEMRLRYEGDNKMGSMGWGVWNYQDPSKTQAAWFFKATPDGNPIDLQAMVVRNSSVVFQQALPSVNINDWHLYRVEFSASGTKFFVDGTVVAQTTQTVTLSQRIEMWIDNYLFSAASGQLQPVGYMTMAQNQKLFVDKVNFLTFDNPTPTPTATRTPTPTLTPTSTPSLAPTVTYSPTLSLTPTPTLRPSSTPSPTFTPTFTPTPTPVSTLYPNKYTVTTGTYQSGSLSSLTKDDNNYLTVKSTTSGITRISRVNFSFTGLNPNIQQGSLSLRFKASSQNVSTRLYLYNFTTSSWDQIGSFTTGTSESTRTLTLSGSSANYIQSGSGKLRVENSLSSSKTFYIYYEIVSITL